MHEHSLIKNLIDKVDEIARGQESGRVTAIKVRLGALAHISAPHFREHFDNETQGSVLEGVMLNVEEMTDPFDPMAQEILLESVDFDDGDG